MSTRVGRSDLGSDPVKLQLLDNGRYQTLISAAGTGQSRWAGNAITRWSADSTVDQQGWHVYLRDVDSGAVWSAGHQPLGASPEDYEIAFTDDVVSFFRTDHGIELRLDVTVVDDADVEIRRCVVTNRSDRPRRIELTSYLEPVLQSAAADNAHPAFSKLFLQTEHDEDRDALIAWRRPRQPDDSFPVMAHWCVGHAGALDFETDRVRFLGRGRGIDRPLALLSGQTLSKTTGSVLDPILCLRTELVLQAGESRLLSFLVGVGETRPALAALQERFSAPAQVDGAFAVYASKADAVTPDAKAEATLPLDFDQALLGAVLYDPPSTAAPLGIDATELRRVRLDYALTTTRSMLLAEVTDDTGIEQAMRALELRRRWQRSALDVDLLLVASDGARHRPDYPTLEGLAKEQGMSIHDRDLIAPSDLAALGVLSAKRLPFNDEADGRELPAVEPLRPEPHGVRAFSPGEFTDEGKAYTFNVNPQAEQWPPLPWTNVIANEQLGFLISESGAANSWSMNSRENRLTPWENDTVSDPHVEALYLRDSESGAYWSPMPGPASGPGEYRVTHGFGYTRFDYALDGLSHETVVFAARHVPFKVVQLTLTNQGTEARDISATAYQQIVLGVSPAETRKAVVTSYDEALDALLAVNPMNGEFADCVAFAALVTAEQTQPTRHTTDRRDFLGRFGTAARPRAITSGEALSAAIGAGLDPCFVLQADCRLAPGQAWTGAWLLGEARSHDEARAILSELRTSRAPLKRLEQELVAVRDHWEALTGGIRISTPATELDVMFNGWLMYQNVSCRLWGRTAFYQSGGAYGFRDQLQDVSSLIYLDPAATRAQIIRHASHQFVDGDVMHWWHPPTSKGIRTRFSDDLLWLPYLVSFYIATTGDDAILDEQATFIDARPLNPGEDEAFLFPTDSGTQGDIYEHCCRILDRSLTTGAHGLPLMGTGDWNDGMNRVGREGRGESVWLGFFLHYVLEAFIPKVAQRGDGPRLKRYQAYLEGLGQALNNAGWDGAWYRRAYYDNGQPMGSAHSDECRIDAIAQAWAVISGVAPKERAESALDALEAQLVDEAGGIIRLLTPPFDRTRNDPGYIRGYLPGIRENGGQYTHGVLWAVKALFEAGRYDTATRLLSMLSPVSHTDIDRYKVEPYVIAADVYGVEPHIGRGGWTWYTGSAGWMYRIILESLLGFRVDNGERLVLQPRIPDAWPGFDLMYRRPGTSTRYRIKVSRGDAAETAMSAYIDGEQAAVEQGAAIVPLVDDGQQHEVELRLTRSGGG